MVAPSCDEGIISAVVATSSSLPDDSKNRPCQKISLPNENDLTRYDTRSSYKKRAMKLRLTESFTFRVTTCSRTRLSPEKGSYVPIMRIMSLLCFVYPSRKSFFLKRASAQRARGHADVRRTKAKKKEEIR